jgi:uncharacterized protein
MSGLSTFAFAANIVEIDKTLAKYSASFDCSKANNFSEKTVCSNKKIGQLDGLLHSTYKSRLSPQFGADKSAMKKEQTKWINVRNACKSEKCVEDSYKNRIIELCEMPVVSGAYWKSDCNIFDD